MVATRGEYIKACDDYSNTQIVSCNISNLPLPNYWTNYDGGNGVIVYLLGIAPNFLPGVGLPALLYVVIPEVTKPQSSLFENRLYWSVGISLLGLIGNEFVTIFAPVRGVFDWNDILWTIIGAGLFVLIHNKLNKTV